jgi:hypothetical protein
MFETAQERVELLRAGITGKKIEELYIKNNNFKIVGNSMFFELIEIDVQENKNVAIGQEVSA